MSAIVSLSVYYNLALFKGIAYKLLLTDRGFFLPSWHPCFRCIYTYRFSLFFFIIISSVFCGSITIMLSIICIQQLHGVLLMNIWIRSRKCSVFLPDDRFEYTEPQKDRKTERQKGQVPRKKPNHFQFFKSLSFFSIVIQIFRFSSLLCLTFCSAEILMICWSVHLRMIML